MHLVGFSLFTLQCHLFITSALDGGAWPEHLILEFWEWVEWKLTGKTEVLREACPCATLSSKTAILTPLLCIIVHVNALHVFLICKGCPLSLGFNIKFIICVSEISWIDGLINLVDDLFIALWFSLYMAPFILLCIE